MQSTMLDPLYQSIHNGAHHFVYSVVKNLYFKLSKVHPWQLYHISFEIHNYFDYINSFPTASKVKRDKLEKFEQSWS
jgi:hypothetical protein